MNNNKNNMITVPDTIKLYKGEEHGVVIETEDFDKSMFYAQYNKASDILKDMMSRNSEIIRKEEKTTARVRIQLNSIDFSFKLSFLSYI